VSSMPLRLIPVVTLVLVAAALAFALRGAERDAGARGASPGAGAGSASAKPPKNVVLISLDTLRADHLGAWGYERETSPRIDAFAKKSVIFRRAVAQAGSTIPSHASLFTSLYPSAVLTKPTLIQGPSGKGAAKLRGTLADWPETLAEHLRNAGFATWGFVDGGNVRRDFGFAQGFDHYADEGVGIEVLGKQARKWIEEHPVDRFFLFLHCYDIHTPYVSPDEYVALFGDPEHAYPMPLHADYFRQVESGEIVMSERDFVEVIARYDAGIRYTDDRIGAFLDWLGERGLLDDTLVVIVSDHGEEMREHGRFGHEQLYLDPNLRVPLVIRAPGARPQVVGETVELVDVVPTILDLLGLPASRDAIGRSLAPVVRGADQIDGARAAFAEIGAGRKSQRTLVDDRWQLLVDPRKKTRRLYDLVADPTASSDLAGSHGEVADRLERELEERHGEARTLAAERSPKHERKRKPKRLRRDVQRELEALGYIQR